MFSWSAAASCHAWAGPPRGWGRAEQAARRPSAGTGLPVGLLGFPCLGASEVQAPLSLLHDGAPSVGRFILVQMMNISAPARTGTPVMSLVDRVVWGHLYTHPSLTVWLWFRLAARCRTAGQVAALTA